MVVIVIMRIGTPPASVATGRRSATRDAMTHPRLAVRL
jgi:hypothetical protein